MWDNIINHYEPDWKFWLGFTMEGNTTHIHTQLSHTTGLFMYQGPQEKWKKGPNFFQRPYPRQRVHILKFYGFFALYGPYWHKNSGEQRNLTPKAVKAKKADIRPNVSKLDFWNFRGLTMVSQHFNILSWRKRGSVSNPKME